MTEREKEPMPQLDMNCPRVRTFEEWLRAPTPLESKHARFDIRRAVPEEFDRLYDLINEVYGLKRSRARYDWMYRRNPYGLARVWVTFDRASGQLVGSRACWPWPMARGTDWVEGTQEGDWVVAPGWQRQRIGSRCWQALRTHAWQLEIVKLGWVNENTRALGIKDGYGAEFLGPIPRAVLILNARSYLAELGWTPLVSSVTGGAIDAALATWCKVVLKRRGDLRIEPVRRFDLSFDEVTGHCMAWPGFWSPHAARFLNWRYFEDPSTEYAAFALMNGSNPAGYYVMKVKGEPWLMEFVAPVSPPHFASTLLLHLIETARAAGCNRIRFSAPPGWRHWKLMRAAGFIARPSEIYMWPGPLEEATERQQLSAWQWVPGDMDAVDR